MISPLLIALTTLSFGADDIQYRSFELADGQTFVAEVVASKATGIQIKLPQGERLLPFSNLAGMQEASASDYAAQPSWEIALSAPPSVLMAFKRAAERVPSVNVWTVGSGWPAANVPIDKQAQAAVCAQDLPCLLTSLDGAPGRFVIAVTESAEGARLESAHTEYNIRSSQETATLDEEELYRALLTTLRLTPPETPFVPAVPNVQPTSVDNLVDASPATQRTRDLRFVPLPGYAAFREGKSENAWLAAAIALPATALWVGATGNHAQTPLAHAGLGLVGFCAISVSANHLTLGEPVRASNDPRIVNP